MILCKSGPKSSQIAVVRMRSENMPKTRLSFCQIVTILAVAEYDGTVEI